MHFTMLAQNEELMHLLHKKGSRFCSTFHYIDPIFHPSIHLSFPVSFLHPSFSTCCAVTKSDDSCRLVLCYENCCIIEEYTFTSPSNHRLAVPPTGRSCLSWAVSIIDTFYLRTHTPTLETSPNGVDRFVDGQKAEPKCNNNGVAVMPDVDGAEGGKFLIAFRAESEASASWKDTLGRRRSQFRTISIASIWAWLCLGSFTSVGKANQMDG